MMKRHHFHHLANAKAQNRAGAWSLALVLLLGLLCVTTPAKADLTQFTGTDAGVGPGIAYPNSANAESQFSSAASQLGNVGTITFENLPLGTPAPGTSLTVAPGVTLTLSNTDQTVIPNYPFGISNASPNPINDGFNITPGGSQFLLFVPQLGASSASVTFHFDAPINSFGFYLTGVGNIQDDLHLLFFDGHSNQDIPLTGSATGGVQFFGFTDPGGIITDITLEQRNVGQFSRDVFGIDNVQFVTVPEPSALILLGLGMVGVLGHGLMRRVGRLPKRL